MKKPLFLLLALVLAIGLVGCHSKAPSEPDEKEVSSASLPPESEAPAASEEPIEQDPDSTVSEISTDSEVDRDALLEQALQKDDPNATYPELVQTVIDVETAYPDFAETASVHKVTLPLPKGWTIEPATEPVQSANIFDHYLPSDSMLASFYLYDEQKTRCGAIGLSQYPTLEDSHFDLYSGNNLHFESENPHASVSRSDAWEARVAVVQHWANEDGVLFNDGIVLQHPDTVVTLTLEINLNRVSDQQLKAIAEQTTIE